MSLLRCAHSGAILLLSFFIWPTLAQDDDPKLAKFRAMSESDTMVMVPMRDGVRLATDVHRPKGDGPFPTVLVKTPYNFNKMGGSTLQFANEAIERGYAVVVQNERGRYYSEGEWEILGKPRTDGYDSLTWIKEQAWSNGRVATWGCSSTAEWQMALAAQDHPAHAAMIPMASGAGIGRVGEYYEQGNWYKGGVHQTLFTVWLYGVQQNIRPQFPRGLSQEQLQRLRKAYDLAAAMPKIDWAKHLRKLPAVDWLKDADGNEGPGAEFMKRKPNDPGWYRGGLYHDDEDFGVPAYWFNSWFDVSQGPNLTLYNHVRNNASDASVRDGQYMMIAPTVQCLPVDSLVGQRQIAQGDRAASQKRATARKAVARFRWSLIFVKESTILEFSSTGYQESLSQDTYELHEHISKLILGRAKLLLSHVFPRFRLGGKPSTMMSSTQSRWSHERQP